MQLAIAVARVYEGDNGPVLAEFLQDKVLPLAVIEGNRWLATWALWMLGKRDKAVRALIVSLSNELFKHTCDDMLICADPAEQFTLATRNSKSAVQAVPY